MNRAPLSTLVATLVATLSFVLALVLIPTAGSPEVGAAAAAAAPQKAPVVVRSATPAGWIPIDFDDLQISIPSTWTVLTGDGAACGSDDTGVLILGRGSWCAPASGETGASDTSVVTVTSSKSPEMPAQAPALRVNGLAVYTPDISPVYFIPALEIEVTQSGPLQPRVLRTVTYSPRAVALAATRSSVPKGWRWVTFKGIRLAVPRSWTVNRTTHAPICGTDARLSRPGVTLASRPALPASCAPPTLTAETPVAGVEVDGFSARQVVGGSSPSPSPSSSPSPCLPPRRINNLRVCIQARPLYGVLIVQVSGSGMPTSTVQIGMFGNGIAGRTILDSLRRS